MKLKYKIINGLEKYVPITIKYFFSRTFYSLYRIWVKERGYTITPDEEKEIRTFFSRYRPKIDLAAHKFYYNVTGNRDYRYIPDYLYYLYVDPFFNNNDVTLAFSDKNYYDMFMPFFRKPAVTVRRIGMEYYDADYTLIDEDKAYALIESDLQKQGELIVKPSFITGSGRKIVFITKEDNIRNIFSDYGSEDIVIQHVIKQHEEMSKMHKNSINTIRIGTLLLNGEASVISSVVRIGVDDNRMDNSHQGGIAVGIDENGRLRKYGYDQDGKRFEVHPQGYVFADGFIPSYDKVVERVLEGQKLFPHYKLINWDVAIDEEGEPVFVEFNLSTAGIKCFQFCNGPLFGDRTSEILDVVFHKK